MPKRCTHFISGFLIPSLDSGRFGDHLKWINKNSRIFQMDWHHKSNTRWTEKQAEIFTEWDKEKGHFQPNDKEYYSRSKQRFRSLLYKMTKEGQLIPLKPESKFQKVYRIGEKKKKKRKSNELEHVEFEPRTEDEISFEENDDEFRDDDTMTTYDFDTNVFGDHSYSQSENSHSRSLESDQNELLDYQDIFGTSLHPSSLEKKVLVRKNCNDEFMNTPTSTSFSDMNELPEIFLQNDDSTQDAENKNAIRPYDKLHEYIYPVYVLPTKLVSENNVLMDIELNTITSWNIQSKSVFDTSQTSVENDP